MKNSAHRDQEANKIFIKHTTSDQTIVVSPAVPICVDGKKRREPPTRASRDKPRRVDPELSPDLGRALDRMVVTEGVPVYLTLQLTRREN
jgi:hypothetical protein